MQQSKETLIRETAITVIAELGCHNATTDRIAKEAGISVGTIYNYFRNKEEILENIFQVELDKRHGFYQKLEGENLTVREKIHQLLIMHFAEIKKNPAVGQVLVRERQFPNRHQLTAITNFIEGVPQVIARLLDTAIANGEIRECNTIIAAAALFGAVEAVVRKGVQEIDSQASTSLFDQAAEELINLFFAGLTEAPVPK